MRKVLIMFKYLTFDTETTSEYGFSIQFEYDETFHKYLVDTLGTKVIRHLNSSIVWYKHLDESILGHDRRTIKAIFTGRSEQKFVFVGYNSSGYDDWMLRYFCGCAETPRDMLEYNGFLIDYIKTVPIARGESFKNFYLNPQNRGDKFCRNLSMYAVSPEMMKFTMQKNRYLSLIRTIDFKAIHNISCGLKDLFAMRTNSNHEGIYASLKSESQFLDYAAKDVTLFREIIDESGFGENYFQNKLSILDVVSEFNKTMENEEIYSFITRTAHTKCLWKIFSMTGKAPSEKPRQEIIEKVKSDALNKISTVISALRIDELKTIGELYVQSRKRSLYDEELGTIQKGIRGLPLARCRNSVKLEGGMHDHATVSELYESDENYSVVDIDYASQYPNIIKQIGVGELGLFEMDRFSEMITRRLKLKASSLKKDKVLSDGFKLLINSFYGLINSEYAHCKEIGNIIPLYASVYILVLIDVVCSNHKSAKILSINTDGVLLKIGANIDLSPDLAEIEKITGIAVELTTYSKFFKRDVNNYIAVFKDGRKKEKGSQCGYPITNKLKCLSKRSTLPVLSRHAHLKFAFGDIVRCLQFASIDGVVYKGYFTFEETPLIPTRIDKYASQMIVAKKPLFFMEESDESKIDNSAYDEVVDAYIHEKINNKKCVFGEKVGGISESKRKMLESAKVFQKTSLGLSYKRLVKIPCLEVVKNEAGSRTLRHVRGSKFSGVVSNMFNNVLEYDAVGGLVLYALDKYVILDVDCPKTMSKKFPELYNFLVNSNKICKSVSTGDLSCMRAKYIFKNNTDQLYKINGSLAETGCEIIQKGTVLSVENSEHNRQKKHYIVNDVKPQSFSKVLGRFLGVFKFAPHQSFYKVDNNTMGVTSSISCTDKFSVSRVDDLGSIIIDMNYCVVCNRIDHSNSKKYRIVCNNAGKFSYTTFGKCETCKSDAETRLSKTGGLHLLSEEDMNLIFNNIVLEDLIELKPASINVAPTGSGKTTSMTHDIIKLLHANDTNKIVCSSSFRVHVGDLASFIKSMLGKFYPLIKKQIVKLVGRGTDTDIANSRLIITHQSYINQLHDTQGNTPKKFKKNLYNYITDNKSNISLYIDEARQCIDALVINVPLAEYRTLSGDPLICEHGVGMNANETTVLSNVSCVKNQYSLEVIGIAPDDEIGFDLVDVLLKKKCLNFKENDCKIDKMSDDVSIRYYWGRVSIESPASLADGDEELTNLLFALYNKPVAFVVNTSIIHKNIEYTSFEALPEIFKTGNDRPCIPKDIFIPILKYKNDSLIASVPSKQIRLINASEFELDGFNIVKHEKKHFGYDGVHLIEAFPDKKNTRIHLSSRKLIPLYEYLHSEGIETLLFAASDMYIEEIVNMFTNSMLEIDAPLSVMKKIYDVMPSHLLFNCKKDTTLDSIVLLLTHVRSSFARGVNFGSKQALVISSDMRINQKSRIDLNRKNIISISPDNSIRINETNSYREELIEQPIGRILRGYGEKIIIYINCDHDREYIKNILKDETVLSHNTIIITSKKSFVEVNDILSKIIPRRE